MKLLYAMCGSFCTHKRSLNALKILAEKHNITPALSEISKSTDTRFGKAQDLLGSVISISGNQPVLSISSAEEIVTRGNYDAVIISPCTGNTLAKIANGITDSTVTMCAKAQLRNRRPVIIALATNDGLGANLFNISLTLEKKNIYFVPFGQDEPFGKPSSLICDFDMLEATLENAVNGIQLQPILLK